MSDIKSNTIIQGINKRVSEDPNQTKDRQRAFFISCEQGDLNLIRSISDEKTVKPTQENNRAFLLICKTGSIQNTDWYISKFGPLSETVLHQGLEYAFTTSNNFPALVDHLLGLYPNLNIHKNDDWIFREAILHGRIEVLKWLKVHTEVDFLKNDLVKNDYHAIRTCMEKGVNHAEVLMWLLEEIDEKNHPLFTQTLLTQACKCDQVKVMNWLVDTKRVSFSKNDFNVPEGKPHKIFGHVIPGETKHDKWLALALGRGSSEIINWFKVLYGDTEHFRWMLKCRTPVFVNREIGVGGL